MLSTQMMNESEEIDPRGRTWEDRPGGTVSSSQVTGRPFLSISEVRGPGVKERKRDLPCPPFETGSAWPEFTTKMRPRSKPGSAVPSTPPELANRVPRFLLPSYFSLGSFHITPLILESGQGVDIRGQNPLSDPSAPRASLHNPIGMERGLYGHPGPKWWISYVACNTMYVHQGAVPTPSG